MIITQLGTHNRSEMVAVPGTPCAIPHNNRNSNPSSFVFEVFGTGKHFREGGRVYLYLYVVTHTD